VPRARSCRSGSGASPPPAVAIDVLASGASQPAAATEPLTLRVLLDSTDMLPVMNPLAQDLQLPEGVRRGQWPAVGRKVAPMAKWASGQWRTSRGVSAVVLGQRSS
jgi:hypothetical protein